MVEHESQHLDAVFHALADPTRRRMLRDLADGERSIGELAAPASMSLAGASKHVRVLETAGLVIRIVQGRTHICRLNAGRMAEADAWLSYYRRYWSSRIDALESALLRDEKKE